MSQKFKFSEENRKHLKDMLESVRKIHFNLCVQNSDESPEERWTFELSRRIEKILYPKE